MPKGTDELAETAVATAARPAIPVLLAGGSGTRLWPLSRSEYPKQFLALAGERTMLQETALRVADTARFRDPVVVAAAEQRFILAEQLRKVGIRPAAVLLEPSPRGTAAAVALAALEAAAADPAAMLLVMPADHAIADVDAFRAAVERARPAAAGGALVVFGIPPRHVEPGFGYIVAGAPIAGGAGARRVRRFLEKPAPARAAALIAPERAFWNSGMLLARADRLVEALGRHAPDVLDACRRAREAARRDDDFVRIDAAAFAAAPSASFDVAVLEKTDRAAVVPVEMGWSDIGSWRAMREASARDASGNAMRGDVLGLDLARCYVRSEGPLVAAVGLSDTVVVATDDAVLVAAEGALPQVREIVARLAAAGRSEHRTPPVAHRPWGCYRVLARGPGFLVKSITIDPGARTSLQYHHQRAEHWVVLRGEAEVMHDGRRMTLAANESTYIPAGIVHRLGNAGSTPLEIVEVQTGPVLDEDDIVRLEDVYKRVG